MILIFQTMLLIGYLMVALWCWVMVKLFELLFELLILLCRLLFYDLLPGLIALLVWLALLVPRAEVPSISV